ncbi:hypothetical protein LDENG_00166790 [Lucifuga dentata]|nr:hypothetical protein LDENG_00166790 [Lucifuga dentata]
MSSYLPKNIISKIIHAFISSRLHYCNSLFSCLTASATSRLQMVQNAAARLLTRTKHREHITPSCSALLTPYIAPRPLRSADQKLLHIPWSRFKTKGDRAFSIIVPTLWNSYPLISTQSSQCSILRNW